MENSPYKFLDYYGFEDQNIFFGRESEATILVADIVVNRLVVLFARTGTGKTSLMNAGVRPRLEARNYRTFYIRVEQDPTKAARDTLQRKGLLEKIDNQEPLSTQLTAIVKTLKKPIVLFFDQFEEFFLHIANRETRREFIKDIAKVYRNAESGVHLVFSMREEYFHQMDEFREDIPSIFHKNSNLRLLPLDEEQARDAIIKPAAVLGVTFDEDLAKEIIKDLKNDKEGIRAPSLQIICDTLWIREDPDDRHLTLEDYEVLGRGQSILNQRLAQDIEDALGEDPDIPQFMQKLLPELETERGTKIPRLVSELANKLEISEELLQRYIAPLKKSHIIKAMTVSGEEAIEWASDYLAERTPLILDVIRSLELHDILQKLQLEESDLNKWLLTEDEFERISFNDTIVRKLNPADLENLFDLSLVYHSHSKLWFDRLSGSAIPDFDLLKKKIHDKDSKIEIRKGALDLLLELGSSQALQVLEEAVYEPEISKEAIVTLIKFPGEQAVQVLARLLEQDEHWESVVFSLGETGGRRALQLLSSLLEMDIKFFQTLRALESLAKSKNLLRDKALGMLEEAVPKLASLVQEERRFFEALDALERLSRTSAQIKSESEKRLKLLEQDNNSSQAGNAAALRDLIALSSRIQSQAEKTLETAIPRSNALLQQEKEISLAIGVLERLAQYTNPSVGREAEKALDTVIPILEIGLESESTRESSRRGLEQIAKIGGHVGDAAKSALQSQPVPPVPHEPFEQDTSYQNKTLFVRHEKGPVSPEVSSKITQLSQRFQKASDRLKHIDPLSIDTPTDPMDSLMPYIRTGTVIPVISNSFRIDQVFSDEESLARRYSKGPAPVEDELPIYDQLIDAWANEIGYPERDTHNLASVARYHATVLRDSSEAKSSYVKSLSNYLLAIASEDVNYRDLVEQYKKWDIPTFSKLVRELDYPRFPSGMEDPLRLLAKLPLPVYITTSYFDFLEQALVREGKQPRTQVIFWSGKTLANSEHQIDHDFTPSAITPAVYHLYGLEDYPQTLVLSEDDYLDFFMSIHEDLDSKDSVIPLKLKVAFADARFLFLGYRVSDWDFKVLLRLLLTYRKNEFSTKSFLPQELSRPGIENEEKSKSSLSRYLDKRQFHIEWATPEMFIKRLWEKWENSR